MPSCSFSFFIRFSVYFLKYSSLTFSLERARGITVHSPPRESDVGEVTVSCSYSAVFFSACSSVGFPPTQPVSTVAVRRSIRKMCFLFSVLIIILSFLSTDRITTTVMILSVSILSQFYICCRP